MAGWVPVPLLLVVLVDAGLPALLDTTINWHKHDSVFEPVSFAASMSTLVLPLRTRLLIQCPTYYDGDKAILYLVSRASALTCSLDSSAKRLGVCVEKAAQLVHVIRPYSPNPVAPEFTPDRDYYVISTSDGTTAGLQQRSGGLCKTHNMRVRLWITDEKPMVVNHTQSDMPRAEPTQREMASGESAPPDPEGSSWQHLLLAQSQVEQRAPAPLLPTELHGTGRWVLEAEQPPAPSTPGPAAGGRPKPPYAYSVDAIVPVRVHPRPNVNGSARARPYLAVLLMTVMIQLGLTL